MARKSQSRPREAEVPFEGEKCALPILRRSRTIQRNKLLELAAKAASFDQQPASALSHKDVLDALLIAQQKFAKVQDRDERILNHPDLPDIDREIGECEDFADTVQAGLAILLRLSTTLTPQPPQQAPVAPLPTPGSHEGSSSATISQDTTNHRDGTSGGVSPLSGVSGPTSQRTPPERSMCTGTRYKLDITPDIFDGNKLQYRGFISQFRNWVGKDPTATDIDRLQALRKLLRGEPKELVSALDITEANFEIALRLLEDNFGQVNIERQRVMASLINLPKIKSPRDLADLRKLLNTVQAGMKTLEAIGTPISAYALAFESSLLAALPSKLLFEFAEMDRLTAMATEDGFSDSSGATSPSPDDVGRRILKLISYVRRYAAHQEQMATLQSTASPGTSVGRGEVGTRKPRNDSREQRKSTVVAAATQDKRKKTRACLFCKTEEHSSSRCQAALSINRRRDILNEQSRCHRCFCPQHQSPSECKGPRVECRVCHSKDHYSSMHVESNTQSQPPDTSAAAVESSAEALSNVSSTIVFIADAYIVAGRDRHPIRVFLDTGSTLSFIKPSARNLIPNSKPVHKAKLSIQAFASRHEIESSRFRVVLSSRHADARVEIFAYEHDFGVHSSSECPPVLRSAVEDFARDHRLADSSLLGQQFAPPPAMLIGIDQFYKIAYLNREKQLIGGIIAKETRFGWILGGHIKPAITGFVSAIRDACCAATLSAAARDVDRLWNLDSIGLGEPKTETSHSSEDESALRQFSEGLVYDGQRYSVSLPKRATIDTLPNNKQVAIRRLDSKLRELHRNPEKYQRYHAEISKFVTEGHAVEVHDFDAGRPDSADGSYYMPHRAVVTAAGETEKWRIVFDCSSSRAGSPSLNSQLLTGPNLNRDLVTLLLNFRLNRVAVSADITAAYMCLSVTPEDGRYFRFLWRFPGEDRLRCFQMCKVTWGAAPSGFLLAATLREHFRRTDAENVHRFAECLYYDDFLKSFPSESEAIRFIDALQSSLGSASMRLAKWKTNNPAVANHLILGGVQSPTLNLADGNILQVLGISWSPAEDKFRFTTQEQSAMVHTGARLTKRFVLRVVASVFDPLGWLNPCTLRGRLLIRRLWDESLKWDDPVPEDVGRDFEAWSTELSSLQNFAFPRAYATAGRLVSSYRLHVFGDASQSAYACAAYSQYCYADGSSDFALMMSKSRLAPRDSPTLPRLELLAAVAATRLKSYIVAGTSIHFERTLFYTDSMIAYFWATSENPGRWKVYVANRVAEIQRNSSPEEWYFIPGIQNIADFATRGVSAQQLRENSAWWNGSPWMRLPQGQWPTSQPKITPTDFGDVQCEMRNLVAVCVPEPPLVDLSRFSSYGKTIRSVAHALRFIYLCRKMEVPRILELQRQAETLIIKWSQQQHFASELSAVRTGEAVPSSSKLSAFRLFLDEDSVLRAKTRLTEGPFLSFDEKNPVVIAGESRLATLLIYHVHRINAHFGVQTILSQLRRRFWVTRARQIVKSLLRKCVICRRRQAATAEQAEAPLPPERATILNPFEVCGLDFCGHFFVLCDGQPTAEKSTGGTPQKCYVAVFTCASTRALHLELVPSLSTNQTLLALRRFISLYPACRMLISDNAKSFVKAATDIKKLFNSIRDKEVKDLLISRRIEWQFNCPRAPWRGGFFERVVGVTKNTLAKTLGRSLVSYEEFRTILAELASTINDRPLSYVSSDGDAPSILTPAHFLRGGTVVSTLSSILPLDRLGPNGVIRGAELRTEHKLRTDYFRALSARWYREYLLELRSANCSKGRVASPIQIGDVCLVKEEKTPRVRWELVRVLESHPGRDGLVRTYTVKFSNGNVTRRAAQLLIPLEVQ